MSKNKSLQLLWVLQAKLSEWFADEKSIKILKGIRVKFSKKDHKIIKSI